MDVRLPNGKLIKGVPEGTSKDAIRQKAIGAGLASEADFQSSTQQQANPQDNKVETPPDDRGAFEKYVSDPALEFAAGVNRGSAQMADFFTADQVNAILQLSGSEKRIPSINETISPATQGGFMPEGIPRQVVGAAGEMLPAFAPMSAPKKAEQAISAVNSGKSLVRKWNDFGIPLMTTDVLPPKTFAGKMASQTAEKIPFAGTGPVRQQQQAMRTKAVDDIASKYGEYSYDAIIASLKTQKNKIKNAAGSVLSNVGMKLDDIGPIDTTRTQEVIARVKSEINKPGVIRSNDAMADLNVLVDAISQPQTFTTLKENRTAFREIVKNTDKADRSQLTSRAKALLEQVGKSMSNDMDDFAKSNLEQLDYTKWKRANAVYASEAEKLTRSKLKTVLDKGDITPESVKQMLFSQNPSEQRILYQSLTQNGRANARSAIISKIMDDMAKTSAGVSPNAFSTRLKKHGSQIGIFFKGEDRKRLEGLGEVLEATRRAQDATITTPTGQSLIGGLTATGLYVDIASTVGVGGTIGGLARLYESAPVRNALLKLGSTPKGSPKHSEALLSAYLAFQIASSENNDQSQGTEQPQQE